MEYSALAQIYAHAIIDGTRSIETVPAPFRSDAQAVLTQLQSNK